MRLCYFQTMFCCSRKACLIIINLLPSRVAFFKTRPKGTGSRALWSYAWHPFRPRSGAPLGQQQCEMGRF